MKEALQVQNLRDTITKLIDHVQKTAPTAMSDIDASLDLTDSTREELEKAIEEYFA